MIWTGDKIGWRDNEFDEDNDTALRYQTVVIYASRKTDDSRGETKH